MTGNSYYTYNYGPSWWQIVIVGLVILAVYDVAREVGFDGLVDAWRDWRERRRDDPIDDASDDPGPDRRFVPSVPRTVLSEDGTTETPYEAEKEPT